MFDTNNASLSELRAFASDNDICIDCDRRLKDSYIDSIQAWQAECGFFEPVEDADISLEELSEELPWEQPAEESPHVCVSFAAILLLVMQLALMLFFVPVLLTGAALKVVAYCIEKMADYAADPRRGGVWGQVQSWVLSV